MGRGRREAGGGGREARGRRPETGGGTGNPGGNSAEPPTEAMNAEAQQPAAWCLRGPRQRLVAARRTAPRRQARRSSVCGVVWGTPTRPLALVAVGRLAPCAHRLRPTHHAAARAQICTTAALLQSPITPCPAQRPAAALAPCCCRLPPPPQPPCRRPFSPAA